MVASATVNKNWKTSPTPEQRKTSTGESSAAHDPQKNRRTASAASAKVLTAAEIPADAHLRRWPCHCSPFPCQALSHQQALWRLQEQWACQHFREWKDTSDLFFASFVGVLNVNSILLDFDKDVSTDCAMPVDHCHQDKSCGAGQTNPVEFESVEKT